MLEGMQFSINHLLESKGMTKKELSNLTDISVEDLLVYSNYDKHDRFSIENLYKIAKVLDCAIEDLFIVNGEFNPITREEIEQYRKDLESYFTDNSGDLEDLIKRIQELNKRDPRKITSIFLSCLKNIGYGDEIKEDCLKRIMKYHKHLKGDVCKKFTESVLHTAPIHLSLNRIIAMAERRKLKNN